MRKVVFEKPFAAQANVRSGAWEVIDKQRRLVAASLHEEEARMIVRCVNAHEALVGASRALEAMVRAFENGWPSHATESIGGLGHMPGESCNACRMMPAYWSAQKALTLAKEPV